MSSNIRKLPDVNLESATSATSVTAVERTAILILGMHRSGTSATTRVMSLLGADLPSNLMLPLADNNEAGFWESLEIYNLNDRILASAGSRWDDWRRFNPEWTKTPTAQRFKVDAAEVLEKEFANSPLFVLKDPRLCRLLPFWLDAIRAFGAKVKCVLPVRNPLEVAASLKKRDGFSPAKSYMLGLRHLLDAEQASRKLPRVFVSYDSLLQDWRVAVAKVSEVLEIAWPRRSAVAEVEIDDFLDDRHRHHSINQAAIDERPEVAGWVRSASEALAMLLLDPYAKKPLKRLDGIRAEFNRASDALGAVVQAEELARQDADEDKDRLAAEHRKVTAQLVEMKSKVQQQQQHVEEKSEKIEQLHNSVSDLQQNIERLREMIKTKEQRISEVEQQEAHREKLLDRAAVHLEQANTKIADCFEEIATLTKTLREREIEIGETKETAEQIKQEKTAQLQSLQQETEEVESRLAERSNEIASLTKLLKETEKAAETSQEHTRWLKQVASILLRGAGTTKQRVLSFVPSPFRYQRQKAEMRKRGIFDSAAYLAANPDVAKSGVDPLRHYIIYGLTEGRRVSPTCGRQDESVDE